MKKIIFSIFSLAIVALLFSSCEKKYDDFMTGDVKTGGLLAPTRSFPYKLGGTTTFDLSIDVKKGPGVVSIEVYKTYTDKPEILDKTIDVASANTAGDITKTITYDYTSLISGLGMPADESVLSIGDAWTLTYVSIMEDGRSVTSGVKTVIGVANFFAGSYARSTWYFHPTAGGTYPDTPYGGIRMDEVDLVAISANECKAGYIGVWTDDELIIKIDANNVVTLDYTTRTDIIDGDPYNAANVNSYDPVTGIIKTYYHYVGASGPRIFWTVYTPL